MPNSLFRQIRCASEQKSDKHNSKFTSFLRESLNAPSSTGAITSSSRFVVNEVIRLANLQHASSVIELGPGTGAFTEKIQHSLKPNAVFFALELNENFVNSTRLRCPSVMIYHDTAYNIPMYLEKYKWPHCDCIISSLPWTIFDNEKQIQLLETISASLKPGGKFISIVYIGASTRVRGRYFSNNLSMHFQNVYKSRIIWKNLPPTQIYCCSNFTN